MASFIISYFICWIWSLWGYSLLSRAINKVRNSRTIAPLSSSTTVWEEFFIKYDQNNNKKVIGKEAVYKVYKIDKKEDYIIGSMTKASRPQEVDKALVLESTKEWKCTITDDSYKINRIYIDTKTGMVVEEIDHMPFLESETIPEEDDC